MRILVVEDERKLAKTIKKGLEQESFAVDIAFDGGYGYDLASTEDYDVVILDLMLPKLNGIDICRRLRQNQIQIPIIMLTAKSQLEDKVNGLNSGADDYLAKPFAFTELLARIKALGRRPKVSLGTELEVEDLSLNTLTHEVKRDGRGIKLSRTEFALLEYLMRNKDKTLTKNQLIEHVWDYDADVLPNTVEVYIGYLRNKIDKPFKNKAALIQTVRGFGYKVGR
ncbi:MAG TPA: response regulator transcription factor [Actinobacteria bacterium]|nr:response regulator transcription factor [Actinomycetes bacterium]HEX21612.1 response regulator transcription factor [Actinomycetota bacterium]